MIDDTCKKRSKVTKRRTEIHYFKNKEGTGTNRCQEIVLYSTGNSKVYYTGWLRVLSTRHSLYSMGKTRKTVEKAENS